MPWCSQMPAGAFEAAGEWEHLVSALAEPGALSLADSRTSASALCACLRSGSWSLAVSLWESFRQVGLRPDVVAMDSVISACASYEMWALGRFFLLESEGTRSRSPLQFLWALAELGISDKFVIASTCREVFLSFYSSRWTAADVALYGWSAAMLGVSCAALSKSMTKLALSQDFSLRQFAELALLQEPELVGMSQETRSEVSSEKAPVTSRCLGGFGPEAFVLRAALLRGARPFRVLHQTAWKLLCDASQAPGLLGALLLRFLPCFGHLGCVIFFEGISSRQSGLPCGKWGDPWTSRCQWHQTFVGVPGQFTPNHGQPLLWEHSVDNVVVYKPANWEVYGWHTKLQLADFVRSTLGVKPIFEDAEHNYGFLHRLDVPSSGLILLAKTYEAWYDLQVQLYAGEIGREYRVLCHGWVPSSRREIRARVREGVLETTKSGGRGKESITKLKVLKRLGPGGLGRHVAITQLSVEILTGRKHQIRSHFAYIGHPTIRDGLYSSASTFKADLVFCARNWLHRHRLSFKDAEGLRHDVCCPLPSDLSLGPEPSNND
eukprot:s129_g21.t1